MDATKVLELLVPKDRGVNPLSQKYIGKYELSPEVYRGLEVSNNWYVLTQTLKPHLDTNKKHKLVVKGITDNSEVVQLSTDTTTYAQTVKFVREDSTKFENLEGIKIVRDIKFGYETNGKSSRVGSINWAAVDTNGKTIAIDFDSNQARQVFENHYLGITFKDEELSELYRLNKLLFTQLREFPATKEKLDEFLLKREHEPGWSQSGFFAYFDSSVFDLRKFQQKHAFSDEQMHAAGYYVQTFSSEGKVSYRPREEEIVLIPFFDKDKNILRWRMRIVHPKLGGAKYLSFPDNKSDDTKYSHLVELYLSNLLKDAAGKDIILTEGEFKCHVTYQATDTICVGIPGISMVTDKIIDALIASKPKSITIILDNDSEAKAIKNADEISNADRAAYEIARQLQRAGYRNVKIGSLKNAADGKKVGIDDFIINLKGNHKPKEVIQQVIQQVIDEAIKPEVYAKLIGLDPVLHELMERRREIKKTVRQFYSIIARGGTKSLELDSDSTSLYLKIAQQLEEMVIPVERAYRQRLMDLYGVTRLNLPNKEKYYFLTAKPIPNAEKKEIIIEENGKALNKADFTSDIVMYVAYPNDLPLQHRAPNAPGVQLPISMQQLSKAFFDGEVSDDVEDLIKRGIIALKKKNFESLSISELKSKINHRTFCLIALAGHMSTIYTPDEYVMNIKVALQFYRGNYIDEVTDIPLLIQKKQGTVAAIVTLPSWQVNSGLNESKSGIEDPQYASEDESRRRMTIRAFLRNVDLSSNTIKFNKILETVFNDLKNKNKAKLSKICERLGIDNSEINFSKSLRLPNILYADVNDFYRLIRKLDDRSLLIQAVQAGLFAVDNNGIIKPRFKEPVLLLPIRDKDRISLRIVPTSETDHTSTALPPVQSIVHTLPGVRGIARQMDPSTLLFRPDPSKNSKNKVIIIAENDLDAVVLNDIYKNQSEIVVVSLKSDLHPKKEIIASLKALKGKKYIFTGSITSTRRYSGLLPSYLPRGLADLYDLASRFRRDDPTSSGFELNYVPLNQTVSEFIATSESKEESKALLKQLIIDCARPLSEIAPKIYFYNGKAHQSVQRIFIKTLEKFERNLYVKTKYTAEKRQQLRKEFIKLEHLYEQLLDWVVKHNNWVDKNSNKFDNPQEAKIALPTNLLEFLQQRYDLKEVKPFEWFIDNSGNFSGLLKVKYRRDREKNNRNNRSFEELLKTVENIFGNTVIDVDSEIPVENKWYQQTVGSGRIEWEKTQVRRKMFSKFNGLIQALGLENKLDAERPFITSIRKIKNSTQWIASITINWADGTSEKFYSLAHSKKAAKHCCAKEVLEKLKPVQQKNLKRSHKFEKLSDVQKIAKKDFASKNQKLIQEAIRKNIISNEWKPVYEYKFDPLRRTWICSIVNLDALMGDSFEVISFVAKTKKHSKQLVCRRLNEILKGYLSKN
jgi:hypothetical protein